MSLYCFVSVPLQEWIVRGCVQTAVYDLCYNFKMYIRQVCNLPALDISILITNTMFLLFHLNFGISFSIASFVVGLYWSEMSLLDNTNIMYPMLSHMFIGFVAFCISFDMFAESLLMMNFPYVMMTSALCGWLALGDRPIRLKDFISSVSKSMPEISILMLRRSLVLN